MITIDMLENILNKAVRIERNSNWFRKINLIVDFYNSRNKKDNDAAMHYINMTTLAIVKSINLLGKVPYIDIESAIKQCFDMDIFPESMEDMFPMILNVSSSKMNKNTIGIIIYLNGKKDIFEGNDEASEKTIEFINNLLGLSSKDVTIYGNHDSDLVDKIKTNGLLPANLYVSPNKQHAAGHYDIGGKDRTLFSGIIKLGDVSQESHVDWRTLKQIKIFNIKLY